MRIALVSSTGASVARVALQEGIPDFRFDLVVTDRLCGAETLAESLGIPSVRIEEGNNEAFSDRLLSELHDHRIDTVILFFTRMLRGPILTHYRGRIINFHPSLLPACPGQSGFEDTMRSGALFYGSTVHMVDDGIDTGQPIIQVVGRRDPNNLDLPHYRHLVFAQQCASLMQLITWLQEGRFVEGECGHYFRNVRYDLETRSQPAWSDEAESLYRRITALKQPQ